MTGRLAVVVLIAGVVLVTGEDTASIASARHLNIFSGESIASEVKKSGYSSSNKYTLHAKEHVSGDSSSSEAEGVDFIIDVRQATPAVTSMTTTSVNGVETQSVHDADIATILVSDDEEMNDGTFALIAVEKQGNGRVNGIIHKSGGRGKGDIKMFQERGQGQQAWVTAAEAFTSPQWSCSVDEAMNYINGDDISHRFLVKDDEKDHGRHHHTTKDDHDYHDPNQHISRPHFHSFDIHNVLDHVNRRLGGDGDDSSLALRFGEKRRLMQGTGKTYTHQVDVYVEIDYFFCQLNSEKCSSGIGRKTLNYVNALFSGANAVYEKEIDTHLNVLHINVNNNYDNASDPVDALLMMWKKYTASLPKWHYTSPTGVVPDLHHALLGNQLGGGVAFLSRVCDPRFGYGVSASLQGSFDSLDSAAVWDMFVFMHEIGHNFDAYHTHNDIYSPRIDTCGCFSGEGNCSEESCPAQLPLDSSATIMSYCHQCRGGYDNIAYTFGGKYTGSGERVNLDSYTNSPLLDGDVSHEPRQVNVRMYKHVASRGSCTKERE